MYNFGNKDKKLQGKLLLLIGLAFLILSPTVGTNWLEGFPPCYFHTRTGLYCPGCGGTRAVIALLQGNLSDSFFYHPLVLYTIVFYVIYSIHYLFKKRDSRHKHTFIRIEIGMYIGIAITIFQWIAKNVSLIAHSASG